MKTQSKFCSIKKIGFKRGGEEGEKDRLRGIRKKIKRRRKGAEEERKKRTRKRRGGK